MKHPGNAPLAEQLRPQKLEEVVGQEHILGKNGAIGRMAESGHFSSLILWGPPGCGKTTIARMIAKQSGYELENISAIDAGVASLKKIFEKAAIFRQDGKRILLFVDEIHRFNRAQQDAFLPHVENGNILLIGATTENPSFELNSALLSRCRVVVLHRLEAAHLLDLLLRVEKHLNCELPLDENARKLLCRMADGDGRYILNLCEELLAANFSTPLTEAELGEFAQTRAALYDKSQEGHYNLISALHKSLRGSDADAGLYWFCRMLAGGEDPRYIGRRLVRFASEDVGMADPQSLLITEAAINTYERLGSPEGELALAHAVVYLATAPKSNAVYTAFNNAMRVAKTSGSLSPPAHILNAPTKLMKEIGYGDGYFYDHDAPNGFSGQNYFPEELGRKDFYHPVERGFEREISKRMAWFAKHREPNKN